jgi:hypothetical protein
MPYEVRTKSMFKRVDKITSGRLQGITPGPEARVMKSEFGFSFSVCSHYMEDVGHRVSSSEMLDSASKIPWKHKNFVLTRYLRRVPG